MNNDHNIIFIKIYQLLRSEILNLFAGEIDNFFDSYDIDRGSLVFKFYYKPLEYSITYEIDRFNKMYLIVNNDMKKEVSVYSSVRLKRINFDTLKRFNSLSINKYIQSCVIETKKVIDSDELLWGSNADNNKFYYRYLSDCKYFNNYSDYIKEYNKIREKLNFD